MNVTFTSDDLEKVMVEFVDRLIKPKQSNLDIITDEMRRSVAENFANESGDGQAWTPLAKETVEEREFLGFPGTNPILIRIGDLFESLTNPNDADHVERIESDTTGFSVIIGTLDPRARELNDGSGRIPARPFLTMDAAQEQRLEQAFDDYFEGLF